MQDRPLIAWRGEQRTDAVLLQFVLRRRLQCRREVEGIVERHTLILERWWARRKRLRGPGVLAIDVTGADRPLLDRPDRLARHPIEHVDEADLRELGDRVDRTALYADRDEIR